VVHHAESRSRRFSAFILFHTRRTSPFVEIVHCAKANEILDRRGKEFWQREYFDHLIRDGKQFDRAIRYTIENPIKAGMKGWKWVYVADSFA
jgi:hypothetical protein